jgi:hypothetical protein
MDFVSKNGIILALSQHNNSLVDITRKHEMRAISTEQFFSGSIENLKSETKQFFTIKKWAHHV